MTKKTQFFRVVLGALLACTILLGTAGCGKSPDPAPESQSATEAPQAPDPAAEPDAPEAAESPDITDEPEAPDAADGPEEPEAPEAADGTDAAEVPEDADETIRDIQDVTFARGYVRVVSPTESGWLPLPEEEDYVFPLRQLFEDGTEAVNNIHVTPTGVYVESANCENQDCVLQGEVTLENMADRVLGNMIICLPHQMVLELYSTEELLNLSGE